MRHPGSLKVGGEQAEFADLTVDVAVVVAYGLILPRAILAAPRHGCLNLHASLLPRWRGAAPLQRAIMAGDEETGVCVMRMEAGLDTGPVCAREAVAIRPEDTAAMLHDRLSALSAKLIGPALERLEAGTLDCEPQAQEGVVYADKIKKAEARIDWTRPAMEIDRHIRGLSPFPGAWTLMDGQRVKLLDARCVADWSASGEGAPGEVIGRDLTVACGSGAIRIVRLQPAGRGPMVADDFQRGRGVAVGTRLG